MLGFLQTIINCLEWIINTISLIISNIGNFFTTVTALFSTVYDTVAILPAPVLICGYICFQVMATRLIITLGFRG